MLEDEQLGSAPAAPLEQSKVKRKQRNRLSAAASRQRKKEWVDALQEQVAQLIDENASLRATVSRLSHGAELSAAVECSAREKLASSKSGSSDRSDEPTHSELSGCDGDSTEGCRSPAGAAAQAGAAASLLAFRLSKSVTTAPSIEGIVTDARLGACLLEHGLTDSAAIAINSDHLAAAAAAARGGGEGGATTACVVDEADGVAGGVYP